MARTNVSAYASTGTTNLVIAGLNLVTGVLIARSLGPTGRGELAAIQTLPTIIAAVAMLGQTDALVYFGSRGRSQAARYLGSAILIALVASLVAGAVFWAAAPLLLGAQTDEVVGHARTYMLIGPLFALVWLPFHLFRGLSRFGEWNAFRLAPVVGWSAIVLVSWTWGDATPWSLALGYLVMTLVIGVLIWWRVLATIGVRLRVEAQRAREMLRFGLPSMGATLPQLMNLRLDQIFLAAFLVPQSLGYYVAAVAWSSCIVPATSALGLVLFPRLGSADGERRLELVGTSARIGLLVAGLGGIVAAALVPVVIPTIFGAAFSAAVVPGIVLCFATPVYAWGFILEEGLRGLGRPGVAMRAQVAGLVVSVVGLAVLVPWLGILGAAVASLLSYTVSVLVCVLALRAAGLPLAAMVVLRRSDVTTLRGAAVRLASRIRPGGA